MRVVFEATSLSLSSGGLCRYTAELSMALARRYGEDEFILLSDQAIETPAGPLPPNLRMGLRPRTWLDRRWWLWGLNGEARRVHADLIHGPDFAVPYLPLHPSVLTLHDLSPWLDPKWHHAAGRVKRRTPVLIKLGIPTMVITNSERVRREAMERFRIHPGRIAAVPLAAPSWLKPEHAARTSPGARPYFLFVGTLEPRKNLPALVAAWREARRECDIDLVLAGRRRADAPHLAEESGLHMLGEVADSRLAALYSGALAFVFPSLYEGFGLPVIEAMQCGACVIASPAVREAGGDAAAYASTHGELVGLMRQAATQPEWVARQRALSLARAREFSWDRTARLTYEVYLEARKRFAG
ncbi:MAG: glycosyltransferase family 4 protein [Acidobacteriia bacterium]|nr:glycosyltransferase family 4 protein [Terriglobia bacterium]